VFDELGQEVAVLVNGRRAAGPYEAVWNANVPSGIYFYRAGEGVCGDQKDDIVEVT